MKIARLHNGVELSFPDDTPDKVIDENVKEIVAAEKEREPRYNTVTMMLDGFYLKMEKRFLEIKNQLVSLPPPKIDLKKLEDSASETRNSLSEIADYIEPMSKGIKQQIAELIKAVIDNKPSKDGKFPRKEIMDVAKSLADSFEASVQKSHAKLQAEMTAMFNQHADVIKQSITDNSNRIQSATIDNAIVIVDAIKAPKDIVFDRETGRPIGVKIKE